MEKEIDEMTVRIATALRLTQSGIKKEVRPSNADLARAARTSGMTIGRYMEGVRAIPVPTFIIICQALGVEPGAILEAAME